MATRVNVLYFIPSLGTGGTERLVVDWATHLDSHRFRVSVCAFRDGLFGRVLRDRGYDAHLIETSVNGHQSGVLWKAWSLRARVARLRALLDREWVDVVHTHHLGPLLYAFLGGFRRRRWRWVHTEHVLPHLDSGYAPWLVRTSRVMLQAPDVVTAVADAVGDYFVREARIPRRRVRVIHNAIDVDQFAAAHDRLGKRRELGIPADAWVVGLVANLRVQKNHPLLLTAFACLFSEVPDARLVLVGDGDQRAALDRLARDLGIQDRVHFLGARLDVPEVLATFDVYCLPSHYEGMPLSLFEAMAAGKPIVATNVLGLREVIRDGETGILVPPENPNALKSALLDLQRTPELAATLADAARRYVDEHCQLGHMIDQYAMLYERVLAGTP
jgi:glycosyltransferase involved in cell wall biosynthesis